MYIKSGGTYEYKEKQTMCVHKKRSAQTCKEKYKALVGKKKKTPQKTWHMDRRFLMDAMSFSNSLEPLML